MEGGLGYASVEEAARMLGVHRNTVRRRIQRGEIPAEQFRQGGRTVYRIPVSWLVAPAHTVAPETVQFWRDQWADAFEEIFSEKLKISEKLGEERARRQAAEQQRDECEAAIASLRVELEELRSMPWPHRDEFGPSPPDPVPGG